MNGSLGTKGGASLNTGRSLWTLQGAAPPIPRVVLQLHWAFRGCRHTSAPWSPRPAEPNVESCPLVPFPTCRLATALKGSQRPPFPCGKDPHSWLKEQQHFPFKSNRHSWYASRCLPCRFLPMPNIRESVPESTRKQGGTQA